MKLVFNDSDRYYYRISWYDAEEGDYGATLGEETYTERQLAKAKPEDWEHIAAVVTAGKSKGVQRDSYGYYWESRSDAAQALREIKVVLKLKSGKPWPDWAVKAKSAGWKPPKNWTP